MEMDLPIFVGILMSICLISPSLAQRISISPSPLEFQAGSDDAEVLCCFYKENRNNLHSDISMFWPDDSPIAYGCSNLQDKMDISCSLPSGDDVCWPVTIPADSKYNGVRIQCSLFANANNEVVAKVSSRLTIIETTESTTTLDKPSTTKHGNLKARDEDGWSPGEIAGFVFALIIAIATIATIVALVVIVVYRRCIKRGNNREGGTTRITEDADGEQGSGTLPLGDIDTVSTSAPSNGNYSSTPSIAQGNDVGFVNADGPSNSSSNLLDARGVSDLPIVFSDGPSGKTLQSRSYTPEEKSPSSLKGTTWVRRRK